MNELRIFDNPEFGQVRTVMIDGEPWFVGKDVAEALGYGEGKSLANAVANHVDEMDKGVTDLMTPGGTQKVIIINESGMYSLIFGSKLPNAKKFKCWVTSEVLPAIRKTGSYSVPLSTAEQIRLLAQGNIELVGRIEGVESEVQGLKNDMRDMPLQVCEADEIQGHVKRKAVKILGGKDSEAYGNKGLRTSVFKDIYGQIKREYGCVASYKSIKRRYVADVHEFIDCYELPTALSEQVRAANAQMRMAM